MSLYLVAGHGASTDPRDAAGHLPTARPRRYPTDTSEAEWDLVAALIPSGGPVSGHGGRPVIYPRRDILDAIRYLIHNGCVWRALPVDYPPWRTVYHYFHAWTTGSILSRLHDTLRERVRVAEGRAASPTAAIIDSQLPGPRHHLRRIPRHRPGHRDQEPRPGRLRRPTPPVGRGENAVLDQPLPAHRPRLRTPTPTPRRHRPMGHDHHHDPPTRPLHNLNRYYTSTKHGRLLLFD